MRQIIHDQSIIYIVVMTVIAIMLSVTCLPEKVSSETDTYLLGRARISYTVPITPTPSCTIETNTGKINYLTIC